MKEGSNDSTVRKTGQFKKFRDNSKRRLDLRKKRQKINPPPNSSNEATIKQIFTRKLLRSIKRRQQQNNPKQKERMHNFRRKLYMPPNNILKDSTETTKHDTSIEEGELISDDELHQTQISLISHAVKSSTITAVDNDDDCICIEPQIEQIVIDDDQPATSRSGTSSGYVSLIQRMNDRDPKLSGQLITSTPLCARSKDAAIQNSTQNNADFCALFYEDVSSINSLENTNSVGGKLIDYSTLRCLSGGRSKKKENRVKKGRQNKSKSKRNKTQKKTNTSKDIIILDDTINDVTIKPMEVEQVEEAKKTQQIDDSVIFISETVGISDKPAPMGDFVPLDSNDVPNPIFVPRSPPRPPRQAAIKSGLFTNSEKKELVAYNNNAYNPNAGDPGAPEKQSKKRLILIDACNVAFNHSLNKEFSVKGLKICIDFFEKMGHEVKAVLPQFRMHKCSDSAAMFELHKAGKIVVTPCKNLPGKFTISYDDRFVLQLASEMDAVIVSNDNYRDLINENSAFKKLIENRVIGFTWCNDLFMVAKDPYGKWGPPLQTILNRT